MPGTKQTLTLAAAFVFFIGALITGVIHYFRTRYLSPFCDEFDNMTVGWLLTQQEKVYDTVFSHHTPLAYMITHIVALLSPSDDFLHFRMLNPVVFVLSSVILLYIAARQSGLRPALFLAGTFSLLTGYFFPVWGGQWVLNNYYSSVFMVLFLMMCLVPVLKGGSLGPGESLISGIVLVFWLSGELLTVFPLIFIALIAALYALLEKVPLHKRMNFAWFTAGCVVVGVVHLIWLLLFGSVSGCFEQAFTFNSAYYSKYTLGTSIPNMYLTAFDDFIKNTWGLYKPFSSYTLLDFTYLLLPISIIVVSWRLKAGTITRILIAALLLLITPGLQIRKWVFQNTAFYFYAFFLFALALQQSLEFLKDKGNALKIPLSAFVIALAFLPLYSFHDMAEWNGAPDENPVLVDYGEAFEFVQSYTSPDDKVSAFNFCPYFYLFNKRKPAQDNLFYFPWQADWDADRPESEQLINQLKKNKPRVIWLDLYTPVWKKYEWEDYAAKVAAFVAENYTPHESFPRLYLLNETGELSTP